MTALELANWLGSGDTGVSSKAIAIAAVGGEKPQRWGWGYPHDPSDFGRCARLLKKHPEIRKPAFDRLAIEGGEGWRKLIARWDEIHAAMDEEVGIDWAKGERAPNTYRLMDDILRHK